MDPDTYEDIGLPSLPSSSLEHGLHRWAWSCGPPHSAPCVDSCVPWISALESIPGSAFLNLLFECLFPGSEWTPPKNRTQHNNRSSVSVVAPAMRLNREEVGREVCTSPKYMQRPIERWSPPSQSPYYLVSGFLLSQCTALLRTSWGSAHYQHKSWTVPIVHLHHHRISNNTSPREEASTVDKKRCDTDWSAFSCHLGSLTLGLLQIHGKTLQH